MLRSTLGHHLPKLNLRLRGHCTLDRGGMFGQPQPLQGMNLNHRTGKLYEYTAIGIRDSFKPKV